MIGASIQQKALTPLSAFFPKWKPNKPIVIISNLNDIVSNLAFEHALTNRSPDELCRQNKDTLGKETNALPLLFLWRNKPCVVIGRNQNPFSECRMDHLEKDGVKLSRRDSGGGAVYQDLGNSIFTFVFTRQMMSRHFGNKVICDALKRGFSKAQIPLFCIIISSDINAVATGRNDLCIGDKKFSGSAYKLLKDKFVHHGTIIRESDLQKVAHYLSPHKLKLKQKIKGTPSVVSRITKLTDHAPDVSHAKICEAITESFANISSVKEDDCNVLTINPDHPLLGEEDFQRSWKRLGSHNWIFGTSPPFELSYFQKLEFGLLELRIRLIEGHVDDIQLFTDSMDETIIPPLFTIFKKTLIGLPANELSVIPPTQVIDWVLFTAAGKTPSKNSATRRFRFFKMMQKVVNYLTCCCNSRKPGKGLTPTSPQAGILIGSGHLDGPPSNINSLAKKNADQTSEDPRSLEEEKARYAEEFQKALEKQITIIAIQLIKKSGLARTLERFQETYPSPEMIIAIDKGLNECIEHPKFASLRDIVRNGPSDENREAAESLSNLIATELIDHACELNVKLTEVFDVDNQSDSSSDSSSGSKSQELVSSTPIQDLQLSNDVIQDPQFINDVIQDAQLSNDDGSDTDRDEKSVESGSSEKSISEKVKNESLIFKGKAGIEEPTE